jgi:transcriptional regulator
LSDKELATKLEAEWKQVKMLKKEAAESRERANRILQFAIDVESRAEQTKKQVYEVKKLVEQLTAFAEEDWKRGALGNAPVNGNKAPSS